MAGDGGRPMRLTSTIASVASTTGAGDFGSYFFGTWTRYVRFCSPISTVRV